MTIFEGSLSVKAVMLAKKRTVEKVWVDQKKKDKDTGFILAKARELKIEVVRCTREEIDEMASGKTHGGILALAGSRVQDVLADCLKTTNPFIAILEGIEDPFNLGYAFRTLYAAGCSGVITSKRDWTSTESTIVKSSAGASEWIHWIISDELAHEVLACQQSGCRVICAQRSDAVSLYEENYQGPLVLAIGGEMRGLSRDVLQLSDQNIFIPYANEFRAALNGSSAVAVISFEVLRQRSLCK